MVSPTRRAFLLLLAAVGLSACTGAEPARVGPAGDPVADPPSCTPPVAELRRPISPGAPLFLFNLYGGPDEVRSIDAVLPEDVRPYFAIQYVPPEPYDDSPAFRERVEAVAAAAEAAGLPLFVQTEHCYTRNETPMSYWSGLFERRASLIGLVFAEISCTGLQLTGLDADYMERMKTTIETVAAHGAYFLWQDMGWDRPGPWEKVPHVFVKAGSDEALYRSIREHAAHVLLMCKQNGDGRRFVGPAAALGWWTSCGVGQWGVNPEDWVWLEAGYRHLYEPSDGWGPFRASWLPVFTYPDALFGMEWMIAASGGATLFALEAPFHGFASLEIERRTPAFEHVLLPLIRGLLARDLIPTRDEVRARMRVAYHPGVPVPPELNGDELFRGLYGPEEDDLYEWLPSTGRYYFLPVLPVLAGQGTTGLFPAVFDDADYARELSDEGDRRAFFDARYPAVGEGDSWFVNMGAHWYVANPHENADVVTTFAFPLNRWAGRVLSGSLSPHTFAVVTEEAAGLRLHLSNYRIDAEADVWANAERVEADPLGYVNEIYIPAPTDGDLRRTVVHLQAPGREPGLEISGHPGFVYTTAFDAGTGVWALTVDHNGPVDVTVALP